jgi:hypothetical protein
MNLERKFSRGATVAALLLLIAATFILTACPPTPSIGEINRNPGKYSGKEIGVQGNVVQTAGFLGTGAYEIDDNTGRIWVLSQGFGVPGKGAHVKVVGTLIQGASFGGRNFGFAIRQTRNVK